MVTASAPGKAYLFGEHAVVYGEPAVPCAIDRRATVTAERTEGPTRVSVGDIALDGFAIEYGDGERSVDVPAGPAAEATGYVERALDAAREAAGAPEAGLAVTVDSAIPVGAGLGSSAAVVVATIRAATAALGTDLGPEELADRAFRVEYEVQDGEASRADTFCATVGGAARVEGDDCQSIAAPDLPLVVGYDGGSGDTGDLVAGVRELREGYGFAADTIEAIGDLVREGTGLLDRGDIGELGRLMDVNHGLLSALGVSARSLDAMVWAARGAGAAGAKLTGAGGGGCVVALDPGGEVERALEFAPDCETAFRAGLDREGVRVE